MYYNVVNIIISYQVGIAFSQIKLEIGIIQTHDIIGKGHTFNQESVAHNLGNGQTEKGIRKGIDTNIVGARSLVVGIVGTNVQDIQTPVGG